jgi:hypothetical protein
MWLVPDPIFADWRLAALDDLLDDDRSDLDVYAGIVDELRRDRCSTSDAGPVLSPAGSRRGDRGCRDRSCGGVA